MSERRSEGLGEAEVRRLIREETMEGRQAPPQGAPTPDPTPIGMAAFALTTFLFAIINAGWLAQIGTFIPLAFFYGGLVQLLSGMWAFRNNNAFGALVFTSYAAFWAALGFFFFSGETLGVLTGVGPAVGFTLVGWTVFTLYVWIAAIKVNRALFILFSVFMLTLVLLDLGFLFAVQGLIVLGGYAGIILALCAWYTSAAGLINHTFRRVVLPLGAPFGEAQTEPALTSPPPEHTPAHPLPEPRQQLTPPPPFAPSPPPEPTKQTPPEDTTQQPTPDATRKESTTQEPPEESQQEPPELLPVTGNQSAEPQPSTTEPAPTAPEPPSEAVSAKPLSGPATSHEISEGSQHRGSEEAEAVSFQDSQEGKRSITAEDIRESSVGKSEVPDQEAAQGEIPAVPESQPDTTDLPIKDYDSLSNNQITKRLSGLSSEEIEQLRDYEAKTKNRRLVIERLEKRIRIIRQAGTTNGEGSSEQI